MTITVETGSGDNPAANSYVSVAGLQGYAELRGYTLPDTDAACEILLIKAMDFVEARRNRFQGVKSSNTQPLQWPRSGVAIDGYGIDSDAIPQELIKAQCELAVSAYTVALQPSILPTDNGQVQSKTVEGAVSISFFEVAGARRLPSFTAAESLLSVISRPSGCWVSRA